MLPLMLGMAGGQMAYNQFVEKPRMDEYNRRQGEVAATQTEFSPWTGKANGVADYKMPQSTVGAGMQGAMSGADMAQKYDQAAQQKALAGAQTDYYKSKTQSPGAQFSAWNRPYKSPDSYNTSMG